MVTLPPGTKDWLVHTVNVSCRGGFSITGENLNYPVGDIDREFSWNVGSLACERYDLSRATWTDTAKQEHNRVMRQKQLEIMRQDAHEEACLARVAPLGGE